MCVSVNTELQCKLYFWPGSTVKNVFEAIKIEYLCPLLVPLSKAKHGTRQTISLIQHGISDVLMKNILFGAQNDK